MKTKIQKAKEKKNSGKKVNVRKLRKLKNKLTGKC